MLPTFKLQNLAATAQANVPVTFGQVFAPGDFKADRGLLGAASDGTYLPIQVDVKATHPDGSVRHAILSMVVPAIGAKGTRTYRLLDADKRSGVLSFVGKPCVIMLTVGGIGYTAVLDLKNDRSVWLNGSVVVERQSAAPFVTSDGVIHPHLMARFAVRDYGINQRVDVTVENDWAYEPGPQNFTYDAAVFIGSTKGYNVANLTHLHHARWRELFWTGDAPQIHVQVDAAYLQATLAVPHYGPEVPAESVLVDCANSLGNVGPMKIGAATAYMPTTGAHSDIGILPQWQWADIMSQDSRARACTLATADGSGSFSMHYRDKVTDRVVSLKDHPRMTLAGRSTDAGKDAFPWLDTGTLDKPKNQSPFTHDIAHHPSLSYYPYLVTGDYYYLEEMHFWSMYCAFNSNPSYRGNEKGLLGPEQLRGQAWGLRTIAQSAYITPDAHPAKQEMVDIVNNNLDWYNSTYTNNPDANKIGVITNGYAIAYDNETATATWMHDFLVATVGELVKLGFNKALPFLDWLSKFTLGRMLEVSWTMGAPYGLRVRDTASSPIYPTIPDCYKAVLGEAFMALPWAGREMAAAWNATGYPMNMYPSDGIYAGDMGNIAYGNMGYPSNMQGAISALVDNDIPGAKKAWDQFMSRSVKCDYTLGGQFNITPKDYTAQYVAPVVDPVDPREWDKIATEGQTVKVPADTIVRYGANGLYVEKVCDGEVTASNAFFGTDPAPNVAKSLEQLIQPTQGNAMTFKITIDGFDSAVQQLAPGSESALSAIRVRVMSPDGAKVLGESSTLPYSLGGLDAGVYPLEIAALDSTGAVMGTAATSTIDTATAPVVTPPALPVSVSLPSTIRASVAQEV